MKGASWTVTGNYFYNSLKQGLPYYNSHFRYYVEEVVMPADGNKSGSNVGKYESFVNYPVTADKYAQKGWCDDSGTDKNDCVESKNHVVEEIRDVRNDCAELFKIPESGIGYSSSFTPPSSASVNPSSSSSVISSSGSTSYETVRLEAEDATCTGCTEKTNQAASGGKYMRTETTGNITFNVNVPTAGTYTVTIRFSNTASNAKTQDIYVNGTKVKSQEFPVTLEGNLGGAAAAFEDMPVQVSLKAGANTFAIIKNWGHVDIDYIEVAVPNQSGPSSSASVTSSTSAIPAITVNGSSFRAYAAGKSIHLEGVQPGQAFAVLDMQGRVLHSGRIPAASGVSVSVARAGVYLIKVGSSVRTVKAY
jgi:hypothetical protein